MARGLNKVMIIGNLGADPEVRAMPSGSTACSLRVATSESWKDKETGENKERTEWHNVTLFGRVAEIAGEYLKKGSKAYFEGSLRTRKWQDKEGNDRYTTEVIATEMQLLDSREGGGQQTSAPQGRSAPQQQRRPAPRQAPASNRGGPDSDGGDFDDDIPFG